jgi:protein-tyrosine phosphatase
MSFFSSLKESFASVGQRASSFIDSSASDPTKGDNKYITKRLLTITFPEEDSTTAAAATATTSTTNSTKLTRLQGISTYLDKHHHDKYLIINLSERAYNYEVFHNNVIEFRFTGYPSPPLDRLLSINQSIHSWIQADHENVVVLHCQAGKDRTVSSVAAYLAWARVNIPDNADTVSTLTVDRAVLLIS